MFKNISIPPFFSFVKKGKVHLLLHNDYKELLFKQGIEDIERFFQKYHATEIYLNGRTPHPLIPIQNGQRVVLRKYSHGGLLKALTRNLYLFGSRSFRELILTEAIRAYGIPTVQPICAAHRLIIPPLYHPYLLTLEVPHAMNLIEYFQKVGNNPSQENILYKRKVIRAAGLLLRKFHQTGFYHGDLQLKNLLVVDDQILLIDFDRSYRKPSLSNRERMKNLLRLNRSAEKWSQLGLPITQTDRLRFFLAYAEKDSEILETLRKSLRAYSISLFFHRIGWTIEKIARNFNLGTKPLKKKSELINSLKIEKTSSTKSPLTPLFQIP